MLTKSQKLNLLLRAILEISIIMALAFWGYSTGNNILSRIIFLVLFTMVGFGIWGAIDFHQFSKYAEYFRLIQELMISLVAAWGLYVSGEVTFSWFLVILTIIYHLLVYLSGEKLLKNDRKQKSQAIGR
jgi:hypothetical protein